MSVSVMVLVLRVIGVVIFVDFYSICVTILHRDRLVVAGRGEGSRGGGLGDVKEMKGRVGGVGVRAFILFS